MANANCRGKSAGPRPWLPVTLRGDGVQDVSRADAIAIFKGRTGRDPFEDDEIVVLMHGVLAGLHDVAPDDSGRTKVRLVDGEFKRLPLEPADLVAPRPKRGRGRPALPESLVYPLSRLVDLVGSSNAALLYLLYRLHTHRGSIVGLRGRGRGGSGVRSAVAVLGLQRRLEQRFDEIRRSRTALQASRSA